ncbi:hypothetical protein AVEN_117902-2 [Araneus ventricosus]|uniref:Uncharacterized protein n=1 Tax=Araneus ventricosus TaxID=182803 RepID=A0A4Y2MID2_ARAVE|nr:hypothetical protein AVEN_117902-2 [Araneus ventricosus]
MHVRLGIRNDPKPNSVVCEKRWKWCGAVDWIIQLVRISTTPCGVPGWRLGVRGSLRKSEKAPLHICACGLKTPNDSSLLAKPYAST